MPNSWVLFDRQKLAEVARMRREGKLTQAESMLLRAEPSPAILDEFRKIASVRAQTAKREKDWAAVVSCLDGYTQLAGKWRGHCLKTVNQEPPTHIPKDLALLEEAKSKLNE